MFDEYFSKLTPEAIKELQRLSDEAKRTRLEFVEVLKREGTRQRKSKETIAKARAAKLLAQEAKVTAYKEVGFDHRGFWQFDNISRGLCRFCASPQDEKGTGLCSECRKGQWKNQ